MKKVIIVAILLIIGLSIKAQSKYTTNPAVYDTTKMGKCSYVLAGKLYLKDSIRIVKVCPDPMVIQLDPYTSRPYTRWDNFQMITKTKTYSINITTDTPKTGEVKIISFIPYK